MSEGVVRVFNFPREKIILLLIHLESPYYNGGKVVKHDEGKDFVDVTFENSTVAQHFLDVGVITIDGNDYKIFPTSESQKLISFQITGLSTSVNEEILLMYLENKTGASDEAIKILSFDSEEGYATFCFPAFDGLKETLQNTKHHLCECELKFLEISDDFADFKRLSCAIKVWMSRLINEFNLKLIFEKHGHEITKIYINETDQTATITYATPKDLGLYKEIHSFEDISFNVQMLIPKFSPSSYDSDVLPDRYIVTNLPLIFDNEHLIQYFSDFLLGKEISKVYYARSHPCIALVVFKLQQDFESLQRVVYSKPFHDKMLGVKQVPKPKSIQVFNVSGIPPDSIRNYFESQKFFNKKITKEFYGDDFALLWFENPSCLEEIVNAGDHILKDKKLKLSLHYESFGIIYPTEDNSDCRCWLQKYFSVKLEPALVNFMLKSDKSRKSIEAELEKRCGVVSWPEALLEGDELVELRIKFNKHKPFDLDRIHTWEKDCLQLINDTKNLLHVCKINLAKETHSNVVSQLFDSLEKPKSLTKLKSGEIRAWDDILVHYKATFLTLAGTRKMVEKIQHSTNEIESKEQIILHRSLSMVTKDLPLKPYQIDFIKKKQLLNLVNVKCEFKESCISLWGLPDDIKETEFKIRGLLSKSLCKRIDCKSFIVELLRDQPKILDHIDDAFLKLNLAVALSVSSSSTLLFYASNNSEVDVALSVLNSKLTQKEISLDENTQATLVKTEWAEIVEMFRSSYLLVIKCNELSITISGLVDVVNLALKSINSYFDEHAFYQKEIVIPKSKYQIITMHLQDEMKTLLKEHNDDKLNKLEIQNKPFCWQLSGTRPNVELMGKKIGDLLQKIKSYKKMIPPLDEFNAYAQSQEGMLALKAIASNTKTVIELCDPASEKEEFDVETEFSNKLKASISLGQDVILNVVHGCILKSNVDVIVNAANGKLHHIGGVAKIISDAAGPDLTKECQSYVKKNGELKVCDVFTSAPGNLKFKAILHAVGPTYRSSEKVKREKQLFEVTKNILKSSEQNKWSKIALPAISTGVFGFPLDVAVDIILKCIKDFAEVSRHVTIIEIVDVKVSVIEEFLKSIKKIFSEKDILLLKEDLIEGRKYERFRASNSEKSNAEIPSLKNNNSKYEQSPLKLVKGSLIEQTVDVIVNSASSDLNLTLGIVAKLISQKAGPGMQKACSDHIKENGNLNYGDIFVSDGFSLPCKFVFHGVCAPYDTSNKSSESSIRCLIGASLKEASKRKLKSIAFPAFGTGILKVPADLVANCMYEETEKFFSNNPITSLTDLRLVVYEKDFKVIQKIEEFLNSGWNEQKYERKLVKKTGSAYQKSFTFSHSKLTVEVFQGDLTKESTDAIVNSTNSTFDFSKGGVAKAVIEKGGQKIVEECKKYGKLDTIAMTSAGNLKCRKIFHVNLEKELEVVNACLSKAEELKLSSLSFPLLMTGQYQKDLSRVIEAMFGRFEKFAKLDHCHLKKVRVVVYDEKEMEKVSKILKEPTGDLEKYIKSLSSPRLSTNHLCIYAMSEENADKALKEIKDALKKNTKQRTIPNPVISKIDDDELAAIMRHAREEEVVINIDVQSGTITLKGLSAKISICENRIMDVIKDAVERNGKLEEAKSIAQQVQWYHKNVDYKKYPSEINLIIEKAFSAKQPKVCWTEENGQYEIDFKNMEEHLVSNPASVVQVKRMTPNEIIPLTWDSISDNLKLFTLNSKSREYGEVESFVTSSSGSLVNSILKIERVQNAHFYKRYSIKKEELNKVFKNNPTIRMEYRLWHTVAPTDVVKDINTHGFNRFKEVRPSHVADVGIGSYFFKSFSDIHQPKPNANGERLAYLCLVLTGRYTNGLPNLKDVPAGSNSLVDDVTNPTVHVVFNDEQAYPEYLIHYN